MIKHYKRRKKRKLNLANILSLFSITLLAIAAVYAFKGVSAAKQKIDVNTINPSEVSENEKNNVDENNPEGEKAEENIIDIDLDSFFKLPLEESSKVSNEYFKDIAFLGDSITEGLKLYAPDGAFVVSHMDATLSNVFEKKYDYYKKQTLLEAISDSKRQYIYVMFGANDLHNSSLEEFIVIYEEVINYLKISNPNSIIFIQSIMPVTEEYSHFSSNFNNTIIAEANKELLKMANKHKLVFLDTNSALANEKGDLDSLSSPNDGILFNEESFKKWVEYILTHCLPKAYEDDILSVQNIIIE